MCVQFKEGLKSSQILTGATRGLPPSIVKLRKSVWASQHLTQSAVGKHLWHHSWYKIMPAAQSGRGTNEPHRGSWASGTPLSLYWEIYRFSLPLSLFFPFSFSSCFAVWLLISANILSTVSSHQTHTPFDFPPKGVKCWTKPFFCRFPSVFLWHCPVWCICLQNDSARCRNLLHAALTLPTAIAHAVLAAQYQKVWVCCPRNVPIFSLCEWNGKCEFTRNVGCWSLD